VGQCLCEPEKCQCPEVFFTIFSHCAVLKQPLDVIKKRFQIAGFQYSATMSAVATSTLAPPAGVWSCARSIVAREGWAALYKGVVPSMLKAAPNAGVTFVAFETFRAALDGSSREK
jgi:hypothetical protein